MPHFVNLYWGWYTSTFYGWFQIHGGSKTWQVTGQLVPEDDGIGAVDACPEIGISGANMGWFGVSLRTWQSPSGDNEMPSPGGVLSCKRSAWIWGDSTTKNWDLNRVLLWFEWNDSTQRESTYVCWLINPFNCRHIHDKSDSHWSYQPTYPVVT